MRRFVAYGLLLVSAALIAWHVILPQRSQSILHASQAAVRTDTCMQMRWPQGSVDLNHAQVPELQTLPGVGEEIAMRIVKERESNGPFVFPEDLLSVSGIGPQKLAQMWEQIRLLPINQ